MDEVNEKIIKALEEKIEIISKIKILTNEKNYFLHKENKDLKNEISYLKEDNRVLTKQLK